jgi:hypothetical protein
VKHPLLALLSLTCCFIMANATPTPAQWQTVIWHNENALASVSHGWQAVVSLERGRLMHFGPANDERNLLLAPPTRDNSNLWGGHRVWLGPQSNWTIIWPPPKEWENSGPESFTNANGVLRLLMGDAKDGWPRLTRTYQWDGAKLICGVEMNGGNRPAQAVQIFQVPADTVVTVHANPTPDFPAGYVRLPSMVSRFSTDFPQPAHVTRTGNELTLHHTGVIEKLGFTPQPLTGRTNGCSLTVTIGKQTGVVIAGPDQGLFTQVYLGGDEQLVELEQLSPLFTVGEPASFAVVLEGKAEK